MRYFYGRADKGNGVGIYWVSKSPPILHRRPLVRQHPEFVTLAWDTRSAVSA